MRLEQLRHLKNRVSQQMDLSISISDEELMDLIEKVVLSEEHPHALTAADIQTYVRRIFSSYRGLDVLQPYVNDPAITEIMVNGHRDLFIEKDGRVIKLEEGFESRERLEDIIQGIVAKVNRTVNESSPIVDARLPDGSRVNVVLPPIALQGPTMTIRKFPESPMTMDNLIVRGALSQEAAELLHLFVIGKYNIFIAGGTGSGKTTFLNALSQWIPSGERIITIEDSAELQIRTVPNLVSLETRNANTEGKGEISMRDLIKSSLRMRPNRIIVGEVRGAEALDMLSAMNTGHDGSLSTGHANSSQDMLSRLETMVLSAAPLPIEVIRKQICSAIDVIVHLSRMRDSSRRVLEISEVVGMKDGEVQLHPIFKFQEEEHSDKARVQGKLQYCNNGLNHLQKLQMAGLQPPKWLFSSKEESS
ncbi:CpaF family protein [Paenibacillus sp. KN14-4R]|uniref:CpaF family protein n=1 Tax=Paenibacillus sp. KN14-4R TaxID=3445773 RepID=UPI003FA14284